MPRQLLRSLPAILLAASPLVSAQGSHTVDELSFGHRRENFADQGHSVPGYQVSNVNHQIQHLSDRLILTPPYPGNAKGALWSVGVTGTSDFTATLEFRASGQDIGSGNLQLWYTKDTSVGVDSIYNVETFDGLALVVDQYGGTGGKVRGFLNDGTKNFRSISNPESLAFGQCDYKYRNLGVPSVLKIMSQEGGGLVVQIDGKNCFHTESVRLPQGYHFGISATTGEQNPDTFELYKMVVSGGHEHWNHAHVEDSSNPNLDNQQQQGTTSQQYHHYDAFAGIPEAIPDRTASEFRSQEEQFADLHNRLQGLSHQMGNLFMEFKSLGENVDKKHAEVLARHGEVIHGVNNMQGSKETGLPPAVVGQLDELVRRVSWLEENIGVIRRDVEGKDYKLILEQLKEAVGQIHGGLNEQLPERLAHRKWQRIEYMRPGMVLANVCGCSILNSSSATRMVCVFDYRDASLVCRRLCHLQEEAEWYAEKVLVKCEDS